MIPPDAQYARVFPDRREQVDYSVVVHVKASQPAAVEQRVFGVEEDAPLAVSDQFLPS
jgi:hypothetical protein